MRALSARSRVSRFPIFVGFAALGLLGCGDVGAPEDIQQVKGDVGAISAPPATAATLSFTSFSDDVAAQAGTESRTLIRSARGYQSFFGHAAPAAVDFSREWVMFYAAGTKPTGGYEASFLAVLRAGSSLIAITQLTSPGASCGTTQALTTPYALIKLPAQPGTSAQFFKQDGVSDCGPSLCAAVLCPTGSDCDPTTGKCVPAPVRCGGIAGIACPGLGTCVDDPNDSCDPAAGGADCGGICSSSKTWRASRAPSSTARRRSARVCPSSLRSVRRCVTSTASTGTCWTRTAARPASAIRRRAIPARP